MARLPALIDAVVANDPRGRPTITHIARLVRDATLIASTTRGAGAAKMTYRDAATLLMAVCGEINPLRAVSAANKLRTLMPVPADEMRIMQSEDLPHHFDWLREPFGFAVALERMIERAPQLVKWEEAYLAQGRGQASATEAGFSLERSITRFAQVPNGFRPGISRPIRVVFYVPGIAAEIHVGMVWSDVSESDAFHEYYVPPPASTGSLDSVDPIYDAMIPIEVGTTTLLALHNAVNAKPRTRGPAAAKSARPSPAKSKRRGGDTRTSKP